ncbi:tripartite motif-containing protein 16-like protein [Acanthochromis polyacanthus]|uniref:tripartite motif-containing protein 16-like protein n=1 Tax=Acanthochromis polyacanthus TaxID=80966 RepID=UPI002233FBCD|nr:tripartite motif-containing protein 16-like protein [Acanthochromis polyacanthus]
MAQRGNQLNSEKLSCSICLDLLKDPVTISCGHSYCMNCIKTHWDGEDRKRIYSCPQCKKIFTSRPELVKSVMLAELVEEQKKTGLQAAAADLCYAGPEDVDEHKGHETVPAAAERTEKQKELEVSRLNIQQRIQDKEKDVELLQQEVKAINVCADKTVEDSEEMFTQMIHLIKKRSLDVKQQIRSQQKAEESQVKELQKKWEQEIRDLKRKDAEMKKLSDTSDHTQFLHNYPSVSTFSESSHSSRINIHPRRHFKDVTAAVKEVRDQIQDILRDSRTDISMTGTQPDVPLSDSQPEPTTRAGFLKYSREITLDPNTAHRYLLLSEGNRKATLKNQQQYPPLYPPNPERFAECWQILSKQSLTGRCYWEVEWRGGGGVKVAVAYKNISREGRSDECQFGFNNKSWALWCYTDRQTFLHNRVKTLLSGPRSSRIGIYLDHSAGILSFYSVSKTMTLLHRVQTTFTEPLLVGFHLWNLHNSAEFIKLK